MWEQGRKGVIAMKNIGIDIKRLRQAKARGEFDNEALKLIDSLTKAAVVLSVDHSWPAGVTMGIVLALDYPAWAQRVLDITQQAQKVIDEKPNESFYRVAVKAAVDHVEGKDIAEGVKEVMVGLPVMDDGLR